MTDKTYLEEFKYKHKNPYHDKLGNFNNFVLRDHESEQQKGKWNTDIFKNNQEIHVEVGTGYGQFMIEYCQKETNINFIGIDYRFKRSFTLAKKLNKLNLHNIRYLRARGERIKFMFNPSEVSRLFYFFPDPWPKARHKKKRLFNQNFIDQIYEVLKTKGEVWIKTDHDDYAKQMEQLIKENSISKKFKIRLMTFDLYNEYPDHILCSFQTKFEKIFLSKQIPIKAFILQKL